MEGAGATRTSLVVMPSAGHRAKRYVGQSYFRKYKVRACANGENLKTKPKTNEQT